MPDAALPMPRRYADCRFLLFSLLIAPIFADTLAIADAFMRLRHFAATADFLPPRFAADTPLFTPYHYYEYCLAPMPLKPAI